MDLIGVVFVVIFSVVSLMIALYALVCPIRATRRARLFQLLLMSFVFLFCFLIFGLISTGQGASSQAQSEKVDYVIEHLEEEDQQQLQGLIDSLD